mgnify:CR=1 FL=1|jgi:hypothetical protein|uniref:Uncharacterized protein n=1 Tax=Siphoviridae sp. ctFRY1 TaxID=2827820 RepID=A0A8S5SU14_9CAUD|nr:MAG TPA: hypothetical protein [Siphoviridae sp. ctFRY1]
MEVFHKLEEWVIIAAAGVAGGFVGARMHPEAAQGPVNFVLFVIVGFLCAVFGAPAIAELTGLTSQRMIAGLGFVTAIFWMPIAARIRELIANARFPGGAK